MSNIDELKKMSDEIIQARIETVRELLQEFPSEYLVKRLNDLLEVQNVRSKDSET